MDPSNRSPIHIIHNAISILEWDKSCRALVGQLGRYPTGDELDDAYWRTLTFTPGDLDAQARAELKQAYTAWINMLMSLHEIVKSVEETAQRQERQRDTTKAGTFVGRPSGLGNAVTGYWQMIGDWANLVWQMGKIFYGMKAGERFDDILQGYSLGRNFFVTESAYMGWVPASAREGDSICVFDGCNLPFVVRPCKGGYQSIGECYIYGLMIRSDEYWKGVGEVQMFSLV
jgi:hypothetical protein